MTFLDILPLAYISDWSSAVAIYEPTFTEDAVQLQKENVQECIAYLLLAGTNVDEKTSNKINGLLANLYEYDMYLQDELESYYVAQE